MYAAASEPRQRLGRSEPCELGVGGYDLPRAQVEAQHERGVRQLRPQALERGLVRQAFGADHDARGAELKQQPDRGDVGGAGVDHHARLGGQCGYDVAMQVAARDRVKIGDVELLESERLAERARDPDGV